MVEITDSGYPKKDEIIHASDVGKTFTGIKTTPSSSDNIKTVYLTRRSDEDDKEVINYCVNTLESSSASTYVSVKAAKSSLQTLANEHHTHTSSSFTELSGWSITESPDKSLVFSVG